MADINQLVIAERLGISRATVSRCFTNHPGINPVTRARVFQVAAEIGYAHLEKRTSSTKKKSAKTTFGVLICTDEEEYLRTDYQNPSEQILAGVTECAHLNGAKVEVHLIDPKVRDLDDPGFLRIDKMRRRWSGLLLVYPFPGPLLDQLSTVMPVVSLVEQFNNTGIDCVDADHYKGISAAIEHLAEAGHRRIGFFTRQYQVEASWSFRRYAAYMEKMVRLKLRVSSKDIINVFPSRELNEEESIDYAAERTRAGVTAWICAADHQAYDLVRGLESRGISVPDRVSVTGFDGIEPPADCPQIGTTQIPFREIGAMGTQRLIERIRKRFGSVQHVLLDCPFVPGATTGPPPVI
ncbi:LacI family DNA-binding transcriptional regulator [Luteolibacter marinus]|uniref:LacI family DNA-binding transcriptional regulator n=1 Tax=Luteolibacter marinus TaxID=2776705 RepID=UPI00186850AA|nr:LacI family DNA-binding transcriptional regulator [Luteolibacter marinus]